MKLVDIGIKDGCGQPVLMEKKEFQIYCDKCGKTKICYVNDRNINFLCKDCRKKEGCLQALKANVIICGDALEELRKLPTESIDLIVTDPPYNVSSDLKIDRSRWGKKQKRKAVINFDYGEWDKMSEDDFEKFTLKWYAECKRVLKKGGSIYIFLMDT